MSRLLIALALVLAACTAPVEPADPVEACVDAWQRFLASDCESCGVCPTVTEDELREGCIDDPDPAAVAATTHCNVDCRDEAEARGEDVCGVASPQLAECSSACD